VEEVKRIAIAIVISSFSIPHSCFCQTVDVKPLKVKHLCGVSDEPNSELVLTSLNGKTGPFVEKIDQGRFDFKKIPVGHYSLNVRQVDDRNEVSNAHPIDVTVASDETTCSRPLKVEVLPGVDAPLGVSFLKVGAKR
jgi:hypothetical protein